MFDLVQNEEVMGRKEFVSDPARSVKVTVEM